MPNTSGSTFRFIAAAVVAAALGGCATGNLWLPAPPKAEAETSAPEPARGSEEHRRIVASVGLVAKPGLSEYVTAVGAKVAAASDCPSMEWNFALLDSPELRAFSTEGGHVYVNRGMIELLRSENDLAAVLAHEIAHNCDRDGPRSDTFDNVAMWGNLAAIGAINPWALLSVFYIPEVAFLPAGAAMGSHARGREIRADRHGAEYLSRAGYPPESMAAALETLRDLDAYERDHPKRCRIFGRPCLRASWIERVYADHPAPDERRAKLGYREAIPVVPEPEFLARLDGLEVGSSTDGSKASVIRVRKIQQGDTFATLAASARIPDAEARLRLLNQRYPSGELEVGQLVKVIE